MKKLSLIIFIIFVFSNIMATEPQIITLNTQIDFEAGETKGISISGNGELKLAPELKEICNTNEAAAWTLVSNKKGKIFYSAGNEGKIFTLDKSGKQILFCQLDEIEVYALEFDNNNTLFAATSPDGKVYRISKEGSPTIFFDHTDRYVWDLLFDKKNNLYVATGDSGNIYKVTPSGKSTVFYKSDEPQIRCLAWDITGDLLAGSHGNGFILRISKTGKAYVIYDSKLKEIFQIEVAKDGTIYAAGLGQPPIRPLVPVEKPEEKKKENGKTDESKKSEIIIGEITIEAPRPQSPRGGTTESAIFKIMPNGIIRNIWDSYDEPVQTILLEDKNKILAGTGKNGKLVTIMPDDEKTVLLDLDESQITAFCKNENGEILLATANMGKIYKFQSHCRLSGYLLSEVIDSYVISKWGSISWDSKVPTECTVNFFTRTGNTEEPNSTWSNWSSALTNNEGENITNPDARFLQWKVQLSTKNRKTTAKVKKVNVSYLQKNLPPEIFSISIHPPGEYYQGSQVNYDVNNPIEENVGFDRGGSHNQSDNRGQYLGRKSYRKGYRTVSWDVMDDNSDKLVYKLYYKEQNDRLWKKLAQNWQSPSFSFDSERVADGTYFFKLEASDSLSNPEDIYLSAVKISDSFDIDNTGPQILDISIKKHSSQITFSFTAKDQYNPIKEIFYSINGKAWKIAYPIDRICDSKTEKFNIKTSFHAVGGDHSVVIKAIDSINNIDFGRINF